MNDPFKMIRYKFYHYAIRTSFFICYLLVLVIPAAFMGCSPKKEVVTEQNRVEVLTRYGKEHKENEVIIETEFGTMKLKLYEDTPLHRANFIKLINDGYYEKADFHRIVPRFMIQGGDNNNKLPYHIPSEFNPNHFHQRGALAMARFDDAENPDKESSSTEFYIVQGQIYTDEDIEEEEKEFGIQVTPEQREIYKTKGGEMSLDTRYTVFGEVTEGFDVIDKIAAVRIHQIDKPVKKIPFRIFYGTTR